MRKLLLERKPLQMLLELRQKLLLRQMLELVLEQLLELLLQMLELVLLRMLMLKRMLQELFSRRKQPESMPTGKRARVIFSCLYFQ
ncbi:hypothetical protein [Undibacterium pigrum]|uniref:Uncharacterized protein n=1 Tax=Undibacterium pigrum TaxID=401470 RepID=A0A318JEF2_9BURK|nr:hypothetical protein [Undibacterium pigrum]PXX46867.1 hypothetical protein DFR42_101443 [Undibacterium pigrum]